MKGFFAFVVVLIISNPYYSQRNLNLSGQYNVNIWRPLTPNGAKYNEEHNNVSDYQFQFAADYRLVKIKDISMNVGICFKHTQYTIFNRLDSFTWLDEKFIFKDPADLISKSSVAGINLSLTKEIKTSSKLSQVFGCRFQFYFFEDYTSYYSSSDLFYSKYFGNFRIGNENEGEQLSKPYYSEEIKPFYLNGINVSVEYLLGIINKAKFDLALKTSLGTNIYSDWDQYKKHIWFGAGLELGFGKK